MKDDHYLALVVPEFKMTNEVKDYFFQQGVQIVKYLDHLGLLFLKSKNKLKTKNLKYIEYIELESHFKAFAKKPSA